MDLNTLNFKIKNNVAIIELNRPKQYNSLNQAMAEDLFKVSLECEDNSEIRSVILTGVGDKAFCAGGDLHSFCLLYTSPSPRDPKTSRMPSSA